MNNDNQQALATELVKDLKTPEVLSKLRLSLPLRLH